MVTTQQINQIIDSLLSNGIESNAWNLVNLKLLINRKLRDISPDSVKEMNRVLTMMQDKDLIQITSKDDYIFTENAKQIYEKGGWLKHIGESLEEAKEEKELRRLTKEQLELSIREMKVNFTQIRNWFWILVATVIVSALLSAWFQSMF